MDDDDMQLWAHELELEHEREEEMLRADPDYLKWLDSLNSTNGDEHGTDCDRKTGL